MKKLIVLLLVILSTNVVLAEDPVYFADENLKAAVEAELGISDPTPTDMLGLTFLDANLCEIVELTGIETAANLTVLLLGGNQISDISPASGLTDLIVLYLWMNQISDISPVSGLTNLTDLSLQYNQISDISPLSGLTNLTDLDLWSNQISDISAVSGLTNLTRLNLPFNQISDISAVSGLTNLTVLRLEDNQISDISAVSGLTNLTYLALSDNQISDISAVSGLTNLIYLGLSSNQIIDISPVSGLKMTHLNLNSNQISDISPLSSLTNLRRLYLTDNPLNCPAYDIYIPIIEENNPDGYLYYDPRPEYCDDPVYFADENLKAAVEAELGISDPTPTDMLGLTYLDANDSEIVELTGIETATNLTVLLLIDNQISDISPVSNLTNLTDLVLIANQISDISAVSGLTNLTWLELHSNQISDISPLSGLTNLLYLILLDNPLDCPAYDIYIPMIEENNPGISLLCDPRPEYCDEPCIVSIDINPNTCPNPLNTKSQMVLPVAILGSDELDVYEIDPTSIELNGVSAIRSNYKDILTSAESCSCGGVVEPDGYPELIVKFEVEALVETLDEVNLGGVIELVLTGVLSDGIPIEGSDCILLRGKTNITEE